MTEEILEEHHAIRLAKHRFVLLIAGAIVASLILVGIALALYAYSGAAQVDLSRPGYSGVRNQVSENQDPISFSNNGPIDKDVLDAYEKLYNKTANQLTSVETFESAALSNDTLRINENPAATSNQ